ncbi:DNA-directed RNA polymerase subunit K [Candidatus Woesearchaeota archaeon]|nr:DNA-directed RNA polymerase subunit K [Candidatus Woesearchaeota archaeon]
MEEYTKYEKARMLGSRSLQLAMGAPFLVKLSEEQLEEIGYDPLEIAKLEFEKGVVPITVKRPMPKAEGVEREAKEAS